VIRGSPLLNVADARRRAKRALPKVVFDYVDGGAEDEHTMLANTTAWRELDFKPRMAVGSVVPNLSTRLFGETLRLPVILAPCGLVRLMHPDGATGVARAASGRGTVSVLSSVAGSPMDEVSRASEGPMWFQLYSAGRKQSESAIEKAAVCGFGALVVTVDTPVLGHRERDLRNGVDPPLRVNAAGVVRLGPQVLAKPTWTWRMARDGIQMLSSPAAPSVLSGSSIASPFTWSDIEWMRTRWKGPLLVKGVLSAGDARRTAASGADGVIVSNHGGRQLEGAPATARVLPEIVSAVGNDIEVLVDGGIRRGSDVVKAMALGAKAVLIGRPYLYGLAAQGRRGVERIIDVFADEMSRTMALLGCPDVDSLDSSWLHPASSGSGIEIHDEHG
jgi:L-lactate dehydrogenase (cytochrome)